MGIRLPPMASIHWVKGGTPQSATQTARTIQGSAALRITALDGGARFREVVVTSCLTGLRMRFGFHQRRKAMRAKMVTVDAAMSASHGPWKVETRSRVAP